MYQILDYKQRAINMIIPYLLEFPQITSIVEQDAERYQDIEKVIWQLATYLKLNDSRGIWLDQKVANSVTNIIYTDVAEDAFTYGTDNPQMQGYGAGHYYSQADYISGTNLTVSESKLIRGVKSKIIRNNFDGTIESFISAIKLLFNAEQVFIYESYPLSVSLMMKGSNLEISTSGTYDTIKSLIAGGVKLNYIYADNNDSSLNIFKYDGVQSYGNMRYAILANDTVDVIPFYGKCIKFTSENKMYVKTNNTLSTNTVFVTCGRLHKNIDTYCSILSCNDATNSLNIYINTENKLNLNINGTINTIDTAMTVGNDYTIIYYKGKLWLISNCILTGSYEEDRSAILNIITNSTPNITTDLLSTNIESNMYINVLVNDDDTIDDLSYGDFIYYNMVIGTNNEESSSLALGNYYITCYGETKVLFNVFDNADHLKIESLQPILRNFYETQNSFRYQANHSLSRSVFFEDSDSIVYNTIAGTSNDFKVSLDVLIPFETHDDMTLFTIKTQDGTNDFLNIKISENNEVMLGILIEVESEDGTKRQEILETTLGDIESYIYNSIEINIDGESSTITGTLNGTNVELPSTYIVDFNNNVTIGGSFNGMIKNISVENDLYNLDLPFETTLNNSIYSHTNNGVKFITVPQYINISRSIIG